MYCRKCGKRISDDSRFCTYCGANVSDSHQKHSAQMAGLPHLDSPKLETQTKTMLLQNNTEMAFNKQENFAAISINAWTYQGLDEVPADLSVTLSILEHKNKIQIASKYQQFQTKYLDISKITNISTITTTKVEHTNKSAGTRAVVGGLLFGSVGALAGASSGLNNQKSRLINCISISYRSNGTNKNLLFVRNSINVFAQNKFIFRVRELMTHSNLNFEEL